MLIVSSSSPPLSVELLSQCVNTMESVPRPPKTETLSAAFSSLPVSLSFPLPRSTISLSNTSEMVSAPARASMSSALLDAIRVLAVSIPVMAL